MTKEDEQDPVRRGRTIPIHSWWGEAVKAKLKKESKNQKWLASELKIDEPELSRALKPFTEKDSKPVLEILIAVSDRLDLPYPVLLPATQREALLLTEQSRMHRSQVYFEGITSGVVNTTGEDQTLDIHSVNGKTQPRKPKRSQRVRQG